VLTVWCGLTHTNWSSRLRHSSMQNQSRFLCPFSNRRTSTLSFMNKWGCTQVQYSRFGENIPVWPAPSANLCYSNTGSTTDLHMPKVVRYTRARGVYHGRKAPGHLPPKRTPLNHSHMNEVSRNECTTYEPNVARSAIAPETLLLQREPNRAEPEPNQTAQRKKKAKEIANATKGRAKLELSERW